MVRRKHKAYVRVSPLGGRGKFRGRDSTGTLVTDDRGTVLAEEASRRMSLVQLTKTGPIPVSNSLQQMRRKKQFIQGISLVSSLFGVMSTCVGYFALQGFPTGQKPASLAWLSAKSGVVSLSLLQIGLVCAYCKQVEMYRKMVLMALEKEAAQGTVGVVPAKALIKCGFECAFHVFTSFPLLFSSKIFDVSREESSVTLSDAIFIGLLLRNYHILRALYWNSQFADFRCKLFAKATNVISSDSFTLRSLLTEYSFSLLLLGYLALVLIPGLIQSSLEDHGNSLTLIWDDFWLVAITQTTIGYGEMHPSTFAGQLSILLTCFSGIFALGLINSLSASTILLSPSERLFASALRSRQVMSAYKEPIVVLLQRWWRLMLKRQTGRKCAQTVVRFYTGLAAYRHVAIEGKRGVDAGVDQLVSHFEVVVRRRTRGFTEYVRPIEHAYTLVRSISRPKT